MKKISIVIPVYNRKADLPRCLGSIQALTADYEVIVVDDGSTDGSYELLQTMDIKQMKLFKNPANKGVNYTRNRGIEQASGDYILFLDSDDMLLPHALDTVSKYVDANPHVQHFLFLITGKQEVKATTPYTISYRDWLTESVYGDFTHVILRDIMLRFPFFEQFRAYENLNWMRVKKVTEPQLVIPEIVTWGDMTRTDNLTKTLNLRSTEAITSKFYYLKKYFELYGADLYAMAPALYQSKFRHAVLLGIAAAKKDDARAMVESSYGQIKSLYKALIFLTPSAALRTLITLK
ncbi:glycosyltransferase family 2 protein [Hymenobacter sp. HDW8]|uniref:glycosyltransferase family 2 protein n=1 Tax=Hymenobacter sp. HDW8 TaxID=2714932 RepID=UPI0014081C86|nr:glycosyltransferase family A protein [Hymenobacter sp. HDW8]QIL77331.1 glycosyltransferase [Hymenobacter sp. HDW8]